VAINNTIGGGAGIPALSASAIKSKTGSGNKPLLKYVTNVSVNTTGAGVTYTVTDKCFLLGASLVNLTTLDTIFTLTDRSSGKILSEQLTPVAGTNLAILNTFWSVTSNTNVASDSALPTPILCETGFTLFVKTTADNSINVDFTYLELA